MILLAVLGAVAFICYYEPLRRQRNMWRFTISARDRPKIVIESVKGAKTSHYNRPTAGFGTVTAVADVERALDDARPGLAIRARRSSRAPVEVCFCRDDRAD